jgi:hypothetical protein
MALIEQRERINFISILSSDATLRKVVPEGTTGAVTRTYELKDGTTGSKIEKIYESVSGKITDIKFADTEFGTLLQVTLTDPDEFLKAEPEVLSMNTSTDFAKDFMKKLPNIDLEKEVTVRPFNFIPEGKTTSLKGLTVIQDVEKKTSTMGYPEADAKLKDEKNEMKRKEGWKRFFKDCEIFLVDYTTENFVSKFDKGIVAETLDSGDVAIPEDY